MQTQMINFVIPKTLLVQVDRMAKRVITSRSELVRVALKNYLAGLKKRENDFRAIRLSGQKVGLSENEAVKLVDEIRDELPMNQKHG